MVTDSTSLVSAAADAVTASTPATSISHDDNDDDRAPPTGRDGGVPATSSGKHISLLSAGMLLTTWSTSSSNVLYPYTFGVLGVVGGPLMMFVAFYINWKSTRWCVAAARATRSETFGDLGAALLGRKGRVVFEGSQILFQQLFLPVAVVLCSGAVQSMLGGGNTNAGTGNGGGGGEGTPSPLASCNGNMVLLFAVLSWLLIQVSREIENITAIAYVSCALMLAMTVSIAVEVISSNNPQWGNATNQGQGQGQSPSQATHGEHAYELFVGVGDHSDRYQWANVLSAIGTFVYSCLPNCIVVETMAALRPRDKVRRAEEWKEERMDGRRDEGWKEGRKEGKTDGSTKRV